MKINKKKLKSKQLLQLHIIKTGIYEQKLKKTPLDTLPNINTSSILIKLKKTIQIIFEFHKKEKKILFVGIPELIEKKINLETNHVALPKIFNITGLFINPTVKESLHPLKNEFKTVTNINFLKLSKKPSLVVLFDSLNSDNIIKEASQVKIPVIKFNSDFVIKNSLSSYNVPGNIETHKKIVNDLFFKIINSIVFTRRKC